MTAAPWRLTVTDAGLSAPLGAERAAHDATRRELAWAQARIERLRAELVAARSGTPTALEAVIRSQSELLDNLQRAQLARDVEMAEHLNKHVCTPRPPKPPTAPAQIILAPGRVW